MRKLLYLICTTPIWFGTCAWSQYVSGYSQWREMSPEDQIVYVMGLFDQTQITGPGDCEAAIADGLASCSQAIQLNAVMIVEAIEAYYSRNPENWGDPPVLGFHEKVVRGACLDYVNEARRELDLPDWQRR